MTTPSGSPASPSSTRPRITAVHPLWAIEGGRITIAASDLPSSEVVLPDVRLGTQAARVVHASPREVSVVVPSGLDFTTYDFALAGEPHRWGDYEIGPPQGQRPSQVLVMRPPGLALAGRH